MEGFPSEESDRTRAEAPRGVCSPAKSSHFRGFHEKKPFVGEQSIAPKTLSLSRENSPRTNRLQQPRLRCQDHRLLLHSEAFGDDQGGQQGRGVPSTRIWSGRRFMGSLGPLFGLLGGFRGSLGPFLGCQGQKTAGGVPLTHQRGGGFETGKNRLNHPHVFVLNMVQPQTKQNGSPHGNP